MQRYRIQVNGLQCFFDEQPLFEPVEFELLGGHFLLIEGPNGIGKTTLLRTLVGLWAGYLGQIEIGYQVAESASVSVSSEPEYMSDLGADTHWVGHAMGLDPILNAVENLAFIGDVMGYRLSDDHIHRMLEKVGLLPHALQNIGSYSAGQRQRLKLCRLLLWSKPIWVLDEPFSSLDKRGVSWLEALVATHRAQGGIVIMTSHQALVSEGPSHSICLQPMSNRYD